MIRQSTEGEKGKKRHQPAAAQAKSGSVEPDPTDTAPDEIDPAEFFDPEEFGIRRKFYSRS